MDSHDHGNLPCDIALVPVLRTDGKPGWAIGAATLNERGYNATTYAPCDTMEEAAEFCEMVNSRLGLTDAQAQTIILSSMRRD